MKTCQTLIMDFYYYAVEFWLIHSNTMQHCNFLFFVGKIHPLFSLNALIIKTVFCELTDGSENPTNTDGSYCACHSKSIKVDEYIAVVSVNSRRSAAVVTVQPPQRVAKPGDGNVASNWSGCYLRTASCISRKNKQKKKNRQWRTCVADVGPRQNNEMLGEMPMQPKDKSALNKSRLWSPGLNTPASFSRILLL